MKHQLRWIYSSLWGLAIALIGIHLLEQGLTYGSMPQALTKSSQFWNLSQACLPEGIKMTDVVSAEIVPGTANTVKTLTVAENLRQLQATCRQQQLVDASGKAIRFYRLQGCWGNPPHNYREIMQQQVETIRRLQATFTVIEMTCNPSGIPYP